MAAHRMEYWNMKKVLHSIKQEVAKAMSDTSTLEAHIKDVSGNVVH